jgi:hypothetical protein
MPTKRTPRQECANAIPHLSLTYLLLQLNSLLDSGRYDKITVEEVENSIEDGTILGFLHERAGQDVDLSILDADFESVFVGHLQDILGAYRGKESRKWGVRQRGLCLLIGWTVEILQRGSGWRPPADPEFEEVYPAPSPTGLNGDTLLDWPHLEED